MIQVDVVVLSALICCQCVQAEEKSTAIVKAAEAKAVSMPRPDISKLKPYDPKQLGTGSNMSVWLPAVDPAKLVPPPPSAVQIFMQRINANYPPTFYKGIPIDTSHMLRKYILPMSTTYVCLLLCSVDCTWVVLICNVCVCEDGRHTWGLILAVQVTGCDLSILLYCWRSSVVAGSQHGSCLLA